jgi:hypothetical protein
LFLILPELAPQYPYDCAEARRAQADATFRDL